MTAGSLDLGALFATVDIVDGPFQSKYTRLVAQFGRLGRDAEKSSAGSAKLDAGLAGVAASADKAAAGLERTSRGSAAAAAAEAKAAAAAERHSVATGNVNRVMVESAGLNARQRQAALQLTAAQDRLNAAQESGVATTRQLASAQAGLIGAQRRVEAAQVSSAERMSTAGRKMSHAITLPVVVAGAVALKSSMDFDKATNVYVTAAGESVKNLGVVRDGIKKTAIETGTSITNLTGAQYILEKANIRGAASQVLLNAAAKGAVEENANLADVVQGATSVMASYHLGTDKSVQVINALKTAAGQSKTTMEEFVKSLATVIPVASAAGISLQQVLGAEATLTQHGTSPAEATQELANTIRNLQAPSNVAVSAMNQLGISSVDVSKNLGRRGLTGTLEFIEGQLPKTGLVYLTTMKQMEAGTADLNAMQAKMPKTLADLSKGFLDGTVSAKTYRKDIRDLGAEGFAQGSQFLALATKVKGYNDALKNGTPAQKTMAAELKALFGGAVGLNTALQLGGHNLDGFKGRVDAVGQSLHDNAKEVEGWDSTSKLASTHAAQFKESLHVLAINAGATLLPMLKEMADKGSGAIKWIEGLSHGQKELLGWSVAIVAMMGPVLAILGRLATMASAVGRAFTTLRSGTLAGNAMGIAGAAGLGYLGGALGSGEVAKHVNGSTGLGAAATVSGGFLGGTAAGAALGSIVPGVGTLVGAGVGGVVGSVAGLVTAFQHSGDAAKEAGREAQAALAAQKVSADALYNSLVAAGGAYTDMTRGEVAGQLNNSGALRIADKAGVDPGKLISGVLGTEGPKGIAQLSAQLENAYAAGKITWPELQKVQKSIGAVGSAAVTSEKKIELQARAMQGGILTARQLGTTMGKLKAAFHGTGTTLDHQTASGLRNNEMLKEEVNSLNAGAVSALKHGHSVRDVATAYETQIGTLRQNLTQMGFNGAEIDRIITKYGHIPKSVATELKKRGVLPADIQKITDKYQAVPHTVTTNLRLIDYITGKLIAIQAHIDSIHGKDVVINEIHVVSGGLNVQGGAGVQARAAGGTILAAASGMTIPPIGGPKSDSVLLRASAGEEVIQNPYAGRFRAALKALNIGDAAGAMQRLGGTPAPRWQSQPKYASASAMQNQPVRPIHLTVALDGQVLKRVIVQPEIERAFVDLSTQIHNGTH